MIKTKEDWGKVYKETESDIYNMLDFLQKRGNIPSNRSEQLTEAVKVKDVYEMLFIFNEIWFTMPESMCRSVNGWFNLCDLCSESWVFGEGK